MGERTWHIDIPPGTPLITSNQRLHHMQLYRLNKNLKDVSFWLARKQRIPHLERARIDGFLMTRDLRRRDPGNWYPTLKACLDGIVSAGVLDDDDWRHVDGPYLSLLPRQPVTGYRVTIREL
jgi:hypothetical protein